MANYVSNALFVHTEDTEHLSTRLRNNSLGTDVTPVAFDAFIQSPEIFLDGTAHVVVSGDLDTIKKVLNLAIKHDFSVGLVPSANQRRLIKYYDLPAGVDAAIDLAL